MGQSMIFRATVKLTFRNIIAFPGREQDLHDQPIQEEKRSARQAYVA